MRCDIFTGNVQGAAYKQASFSAVGSKFPGHKDRHHDRSRMGEHRRGSGGHRKVEAYNRRYTRNKHSGASFEVQEISSGTRSVDRYNRLSSAHVCSRACGFEAAGDIGDIAFVKGTCQGTACSGGRTVTALTCGREERGSQAHAVRPS